MGGALRAALLLSSAAMAQARPTDIDKSCRMNGAIAHAIAFDRDRGISVGESQRTMQQYASPASVRLPRRERVSCAHGACGVSVVRVDG